MVDDAHDGRTVTSPVGTSPCLAWRQRARLVARQAVDRLPARASLRLVDAVEGRRGEPELRWLPVLAAGVATAVDGGANRGLYARRLARLCPSVLACEPQPALARRLAAATPANVTVLPVALSATAGPAAFRIPRMGSVATHTRGALAEANGQTHESASEPADERATEVTDAITVLRLRLDDLALDDVGFVKVDVEGHELDVLRGATDTLARCRPRLLVECEVDGGTHPDAVGDWLAALGYEGWFHHRGSLLPLNEFDADRHQGRRKAVAEPSRPDRAVNFLFLLPQDARRTIPALRALSARP